MMNSQNVLLMLHTMAHLAASWRMSTGPHGWWAYTQCAREQLGYGVLRGHFAFAWEVR